MSKRLNPIGATDYAFRKGDLSYMNLLQSVSFLVCLCLLICMIASAIYLLRYMAVKSRKQGKFSLSTPPAATALGVFVLSLAGAVLVLIFGMTPEAAGPGGTPVNTVSSDNAALFLKESRTAIGQVVLGEQDTEAAKQKLDTLKSNYPSENTGAYYISVVSQLDAAKKAQGYLAAIKAGDNKAIDRLVRFYYEDYRKNSLQYSEVPEYKVFALICEDKLLVGNADAAAVIQAGTVTYMNYCMQCPVTKTRLEILFYLSNLLKDIGFENEQANYFSDKANQVLCSPADVVSVSSSRAE